MNIELIKSALLKIMPAVISYAIGKGFINQEIGDQIPALVDWIAMGIVLVPTLIRSWKNYKK